MKIKNCFSVTSGLGWAAFCVLLFGCGAVTPSFKMLESPSAGHQDELDRLVNDYFTSGEPAQMRAAMERSVSIAPDSAVAHILAADLARFEGRREDRMRHLMKSLLDPSNPMAELQLLSILELHWDRHERLTLESLFNTLSSEHPDPSVRARASYILSMSLFRRGKVQAAKRAAKNIGYQLPLAIIGTWDNDQGKGFDVAYPPEREIDLDESYYGQTVQIGWRPDPERSVQHYVDLAEMLYPSQWAVGYAVSSINVKQEGRYELRISTADSLKIWVNDRVVFRERQIGSWCFDGIVVPVRLRAGVNRILIKSVQSTGGWDLSARLTDAGGAPIDAQAVTPMPFDSPFEPDLTDDSVPIDASVVVGNRLQNLNGNNILKSLSAVLWAGQLGLSTYRLSCVEEFSHTYPDSIRFDYELATALWDSDERGRTSDLLMSLTQRAGDAFVLFPLKQARFWRQNNLTRKARNSLLAIKKDHPDIPAPFFALAGLFERESWTEDRCFLLEEIDSRWPDWPRVQEGLASCYHALGFVPEAMRIYLELHRHYPGDFEILRELYTAAMDASAFEVAEGYALQMTLLRPHWRSSWQRLGRVRRVRGDSIGAQRAFEKIVDLAPTHPTAYDKLARLAYQSENRDSAIELWQKALNREPDNEELANRLAFLSPPKSGPWHKDVPTEQEIEAILAGRQNVEYSSAANVAWLLDHQVVELKKDGSTAGVITMVMHALNVSGRDQITQQSLPPLGRTRILHAYSVDPQGNRMEASSIRGSEIRFRQLDVGSTVVVQYRFDAPPDPILGNYYNLIWWFQSKMVQFVDSRFVLWAPKEDNIAEHVQGDVSRSETDEGKFKRIVWQAQNTPVLVAEDYSAPMRDIAWHMMMSTVPDWNVFVRWEEALLEGVFRESPQITQLAKELFSGTDEVLEKLLRIQAYLSTEVRYQQDYERLIAGVRPHTAPMVLARRYGDCKDKSVLFITLARIAGIEAHFALVRTREMGAVRKGVPAQQFNHAIVYVPAQKGLEEGRFFDPTADALDVTVIRNDDPGTWSFVIDPQKPGAYNWHQIPLPDPSENYSKKEIKIDLSGDGSATMNLLVRLQGALGGLLRRVARNEEQLVQLVQVMLSAMAPGAMLTSIDGVRAVDIRTPAEIEVSAKVPSLVRVENKEMRMKVPFDGHPEKLFNLETRSGPITMGIPASFKWTTIIDFPSDKKVKAIPSSFEVELDCMRVERSVTHKGSRITANVAISYRCERIEAEQYPKYREVVQSLVKSFDEDVVFVSKK